MWSDLACVESGKKIVEGQGELMLRLIMDHIEHCHSSDTLYNFSVPCSNSHY